jgi:hypothetical protein
MEFVVDFEFGKIGERRKIFLTKLNDSSLGEGLIERPSTGDQIEVDVKMAKPDLIMDGERPMSKTSVVRNWGRPPDISD